MNLPIEIWPPVAVVLVCHFLNGEALTSLHHCLSQFSTRLNQFTLHIPFHYTSTDLHQSRFLPSSQSHPFRVLSSVHHRFIYPPSSPPVLPCNRIRLLPDATRPFFPGAKIICLAASAMPHRTTPASSLIDSFFFWRLSVRSIPSLVAVLPSTRRLLSLLPFTAPLFVRSLS